MFDDQLQASYKAYRGQMENPRTRQFSMEFEGIAEAEFEAAVTDPKSAVLHDGETTIPLIVPTVHLPWYNEPFFYQKASSGQLLYYYNNLPALMDANLDSYLAALAPVLEQLADKGGLLVADHTQIDKPVFNRDLDYLLMRLGLKSKDLLARKTPQHYMYARQLLRTDRAEPRLAEHDFAGSYRTARAAGHLASEKAVLLTELDDEAAEHIWQYYHGAFAALNDQDPILASFNQADLTTMLQDPNFLKFAYMNGHDIANLLIVTDIRNCDWMNQAYYQNTFPEAYDTGCIYYSPCVVSNPNTSTKTVGMSRATMGLLIRGFVEANVDPVLSFVCDEVSNTQVPKLTEHSVNGTGKLTTDMSYPELLHIFRAFSFKRR